MEYSDLLAIIPAGALAAVAGWFGKAFLSQQALEAQTKRASINAIADVEKHRDGLTFQLLDAARVELSEMRKEVSKLRPLEAHLFHLQQALEHIEALLSTDDSEREVAERNAKAFLRRMRTNPSGSSHIDERDSPDKDS